MQLSVYVEQGCPSCERALAIAREVDVRHPEVEVDVIDVSETDERPVDVFAVPTFAIDGKVVSLGTPKQDELERAIKAASGVG